MKTVHQLIEDVTTAAEEQVNVHLAEISKRHPDEKYPVQSTYRLSAYQKLERLKKWLLRRAARTMAADGELNILQRMFVRKYLARLHRRFREHFARAAMKEKVEAP